MAGDTTDIVISVALDEALLAAVPNLSGVANESLKDGVEQLCASLGIPGEVGITIEPRAEAERTRGPIRIAANGVACQIPDKLLLWTQHYARGLQSSVAAKVSDVEQWLTSPDTNLDTIVEFLTLTCVEVLSAQPSVLLGIDQTAAYLAALTGSDGGSTAFTRPEDLDANRSMLAALLDLRISLADTDTVAAVWAGQAQRSRSDVAEALIEALRRKTIEVQISKDHLKQLTEADPDNSRNVFPFLREGMFAESGLLYPRFHFVPSEELKPGAFRFKINDLTTLPLLGLAPDQCLVNDTRERLIEQSLQATATMNPASGHPGSLIPLAERAAAEAKNLTTWGNIDYLVLTFADTLRGSARCFVHISSVERWLQKIVDEPGSHSLATTVKARVRPERLTRILRALATEGISIRNARAILEALFDLPEPPDADSARATEKEAVAFVRGRLKYQIRHKYSRGGNLVSVYLLDNAIEQILVARSISDAQKDQIRSAIENELADVPPTAVVPLVLATSAARPQLLDIVRPAFPRLNLVAYDDLPGDTAVEPVARISLPATVNA